MTINNLTLVETKEMSENRIQVELGKRMKFLREDLHMNNEEAANFMSSTMNLAIALQEKWDSKKHN